MRSRRRPPQYLFTLVCRARAAYERRVREQKLRAEVMAAKRENAEFVQLVEQGKQIQKMEERKVRGARDGGDLPASRVVPLTVCCCRARADEPARGGARGQSHARSEAHPPQVCRQPEPSRDLRDNPTDGARTRASFHQKESVSEGGSSRLVDDALLSQIFPVSS